MIATIEGRKGGIILNLFGGIHHAGFIDEQEVESMRGKRQSVSSRQEKLGNRNVSSILHMSNMRYLGNKRMELPK